MSDTQQEAPTDSPTGTANPPKPEPPAREAEKTEDSTDWKAEARKWEQRAKENSTAAARLAEYEDAQKTEAQRAADAQAAAERRAADAEARVTRRDVAIEHSLSKEDAALLDDLTDEDAMRRLAVRLAAAAEAQAGPRAPRPNPAQREGNSPADDKDAQARAFFGI